MNPCVMVVAVGRCSSQGNGLLVRATLLGLLQRH